MYISELRIENFRRFGAGARALVLPLKPGLTALVGENDAGKSAIIDALRLVLGTRDQELLRVETTDFHIPGEGSTRVDQIVIRLQFRNLTSADRGAFAEFLTYETVAGKLQTTLIVTWVVKRNTQESSSRRTLPAEWRTGANGDGPLLDLGARSLLTATYLRPLRDAERAMSAGRGSRLSQILQHAKEVRETGQGFDRNAKPLPEPTTLSVLGLGDYASYLFEHSEGITKARDRLNVDFLKPLSFANDILASRIGVGGAQDDALRLRQLLEKLELALTGGQGSFGASGRGLGSNNLLFMACELLLLAAERDGFPLLLIEEPEAHLHPQRQLRLMAFLQAQAERKREDDQRIQILVTTHSPNLASELKLDNLVLIEGGRAFPLGKGKTQLSETDYRFLERFLDVTKANLFFARAVVIVEGDAENLLLPVVASLLGRRFEDYGVSVVNVGGVGLGRYARIFMRQHPDEDGMINIPVACVADMDVMPDDAPGIVGKIKPGDPIPPLASSRRRWRVKGDFPGNALAAQRDRIRAKATDQKVETFVADEWTLEFDLAHAGLDRWVWCSAAMALADETIQSGRTTVEAVQVTAEAQFDDLLERHPVAVTRAAYIYACFEVGGASKAIAAQYLADLLIDRVDKGLLSSDALRRSLPAYLIAAIEHVTAPLVPKAAATAPETPA